MAAWLLKCLIFMYKILTEWRIKILRSLIWQHLQKGNMYIYIILCMYNKHYTNISRKPNGRSKMPIKHIFELQFS